MLFTEPYVGAWGATNSYIRSQLFDFLIAWKRLAIALKSFDKMGDMLCLSSINQVDRWVVSKRFDCEDASRQRIKR